MITSSFRLFVSLFLVGVASIFSAFAQTSATIDPRNYSLANPFFVPNLPNLASFNLIIKTGSPVYVTINGMDKKSTYYLQGANGGAGTGAINNLINDKIEINLPGTWLWQYRENGITKTTTIIVNYQADLQDQTIGSATYGDYPDFIWVPQGGSATVGAGKYMASYKWKTLSELSFPFVGSIADSTRTFSTGSYIVRSNDGNGGINNDTITILEKPIINNTAKTINFPTTVSGIGYQLRQYTSHTGADTTWVASQSFVGDGAAKSIALADGVYKLQVVRDVHSAVYPYGNLVVGTATGIAPATRSVGYRIGKGVVQFDGEVSLRWYSSGGVLLRSVAGSHFVIPRGASLFRAIATDGGTASGKLIR